MNRLTLAFLVVLVLVAACSPVALTPTEEAPQPQTINREAVLAEPEVVAQMLADPSQSMDGVVAMLAGLGIGVYTPDGRQILQGSETSEDDFFLYDFEVPLLGAMADESAQPFSDLHAALARAGYTGTPAELALAFTTAFGEQPEGFLPRLFAAMGVGADQPDLTPLQSWLLLLSATPPNSPSSKTTTTLAISRSPVARCGGIITGSGVQPFWVVGQQPWLEDLEFQQAEDIYYALHGPILQQAVSGILSVDPPIIHEGHGGPGETSQLTTQLNVQFYPQSVWAGGCGGLVNLIQPVSGPIAAVPVEWHLGSDLTAHGTLAVPAGGSRTDENGRAIVTFTAQPEASGGQGAEQFLIGGVTALLPAKDVFQSYLGITDPRLLIFVPNQITLQENLSITWHESDPTPEPEPNCSVGIPTGEYKGTLVYSTTTAYLSHDGTGEIRFTVDADGTVTGSWDLSYVSKSSTGQMGTGAVSDGVVGGTARELLLSGTNIVTTSHGTGTTVPWPDTPLTVQPVCDGQVVAEFRAGALSVSILASP